MVVIDVGNLDIVEIYNVVLVTYQDTFSTVYTHAFLNGYPNKPNKMENYASEAKNNPEQESIISTSLCKITR